MTDTRSNKFLRSVGGANVLLTPAEQKHTPGPWTYFVGNANGRGLIRVEADHDSPAAGTHIASLTRDRVEDAKLIISAVNERDRLVVEKGALLIGQRHFKAINAELVKALENLLNGPAEGYVSPSEPDSFENRTCAARTALARAGRGTL